MFRYGCHFHTPALYLPLSRSLVVFIRRPSRNSVRVTSMPSEYHRDHQSHRLRKWQDRGVHETTTKLGGRCTVVIGRWSHWRYFWYYFATARRRNVCKWGLVSAFYRTAIITIWPVSLTKRWWFFRTINLHRHFSICIFRKHPWVWIILYLRSERI